MGSGCLIYINKIDISSVTMISRTTCILKFTLLNQRLTLTCHQPAILTGCYYFYEVTRDTAATCTGVDSRDSGQFMS